MKRLLPLLLLSACVTAPDPSFPTIGSIDDMARGILPANAQIEDLGGEFAWSEGPVWIEDGYLLFTDVPSNAIWKFSDTEGLSLWMLPAGSKVKEDFTSSPGANGLYPYGAGKILVPDHGNRALYVMDVETQVKTVLVDKFEGKRLNSPNDVVVHSSGMIYFTDPPYGLTNQDDNPAKELDFNGVFALSPDGDLSVIDRTLTRPNGIALSPDGRSLYVANSDPDDSKFMTYPVTADGDVGAGSLFLDVSTERESEGFGNPDGMAVATDGTIFATGPGGVWVISPEGDKLGLIRTGKPVANVAFGDADRKMLYMTSYDRLTRIHTRKTGL